MGDSDQGSTTAGSETREKRVAPGASAAKKLKTVKESRAPTGEASSEVTGFDRGLQPEKIISATEISGELLFLMKWKDSDQGELVPARQFNVKCPQMVISFYEEKLKLSLHSNSANDDE